MIRRRVATVEYLRGPAAVAVAWFHLTNGYSPGFAKASGSLGWLGVQTFFVISGFIIPYAIHSTYQGYGLSDYPGFVARRAARLEPPYLASIALVIALAYASSLAPIFAGPKFDVHIGQVAAHFLYLVPIFKLEWLQPVYWTLAYECMFYLFIGLAFPLICARTSNRWLWLLAVAGLLAAVQLGALPFQLLLFALGIAVYRRICGMDHWSFTVLALGLAAVGFGLQKEFYIGVVGVRSAVVIWVLNGFTLPPIFDRLFSGLAAISYSLYLVHIPIGGRVVHLGARFVKGPAAEIALSLFGLVVSIVFAAIFWRVFEQPAVRFARRIGRPKTAGSVEGEAVTNAIGSR